MAPDRKIAELKVRRGLPALGLFLATGAFILTKTGRDALYIQEGGIEALPWAYVGIAALAPLFAWGMLALIRRLGARTARVAAMLAMAVFQLLVSMVATPGGGVVMTLVFMLIPLIYGVLLSVAWLLGSELLEGWPDKQRATSYGIFGAASVAGGAVGAGLARLLSADVEPQILFVLGAAGLTAAAGVLGYAHRRFPLAVDSMPSIDGGGHKGAMPSTRKVAAHLRHPYIRSLFLAAVAAGFVGVFIEFLFFYSVSTAAATGKENTAFFSGFYLTLTVGSLILQLTLTPLLQRLVGLRGSLLVLPFAVAAGAVSITMGAIGFGYSSLRVLEGGLKSSVHRSSWERTYGSISQQDRSAIKVIVEGLGVRMAEGLAGVLILFWLLFAANSGSPADPLPLNLLLLLGVAGWLASSLGLYKSTGSLAVASEALPMSSCGHPADGCPITATLGEEIGRTRAGAKQFSDEKAAADK